MSEIRDRAKIAAKEMIRTGWGRWSDAVTDLLAELMAVEAEFKKAPLAYCGKHGYFVATNNEDDECPRCGLERVEGELNYCRNQWIEDEVAKAGLVARQQAAQECVEIVGGYVGSEPIVHDVRSHFKLQEAAE